MPLLASISTARVKTGQIVHYQVWGDKHSPITDIWLIVDDTTIVDRKEYHWWRLIIRKSDGSALGVKALSEYVPMTWSGGPGEFLRYIYSPAPGTVLEYVDQSTHRALLPSLDFKKNFLPRPAVDARYQEGFATVGSFLGQTIRKLPGIGSCPQVSFANPKRLEIRTDFIIGTSRTFKDNGVKPPPGENWTFVEWDESDVKAMIAAGFNYFGTTPKIRSFVENEPVFYTGPMTFPDDYYRSNHLAAAMFIDEPGIRLGFSGYAAGPEVVAEALRQKTYEEQTPTKRFIGRFGTMELYRPLAPSWETEYSTAFHQLQAGAAGIVHEGRYVHRGYGWWPEAIFGNGVEGLSEKDQFNFVYAFLRGAARAFNRTWGTSLYGQSDPELRLPAFIRAYEMGAKYFWFWTSDHDHHMPFTEQLKLAKQLCEYAKTHPRPDQKTLLKQAEVGIVLPSGYIFNWGAPWGMKRDQLTPGGVTYGEVIAAMAWEGILCSRKGIEFDFLVDHPGIEKLGYKRLIWVKEDATLKVLPPWKEKRAPKGLKLEVAPKKSNLITSNQSINAQYTIPRAENIHVDGNLSDWGKALWTKLGPDKWFGESFDIKLNIVVPEDSTTSQRNSYLGMTVEPISEELKAKYALEAWTHEAFVIITKIEPGSAADKAGLKEGDAIITVGDTIIKSEYQLQTILQRYKDTPGVSIPIEIRRSGKSNYGGEKDLYAEYAFAWDDTCLYFAAKVQDDKHVQSKVGSDIWMHDSVQLAFDPILERAKDYGDNSQKIGFALRGNQVVTWRWDGRRGHPLGELRNCKVKVVRKGNTTTYEAAIPFSELMPMSPGLWPKFGANVVVNDSDDPVTGRKSRLELVYGASTRGNHPDQFAVFECAPSTNKEKIWGAIIWEKRAMKVGGATELTIGLRSAKNNYALVKAELSSRDTPETKPLTAQAKVRVLDHPTEYTLQVFNESPPGRYRLKVVLAEPTGETITEDAMDIFVYQ
jgi:hypothetical protein